MSSWTHSPNAIYKPKEEIKPYSILLTVNFKKLSENAIMPKKADDGSVGYDLYAAEDKTIDIMHHALIKTDIAIELPNGYEAQIRSRSGLALKNQIFVLNGVGTIDSSYRGNVGIILQNLGESTFTVNKGDRIAQMVFNKVELPSLTEVKELSETARGEGGFGSTGVKK